MREDGIYTDVPDEEYRAWEAENQSGLKDFARSPRRYRHAPRAARTKAQADGTAIHCALLEPLVFAERYVTGPDVNLATKAGRAEWADFVEANPERIHLRHGEGVMVEGIKAAVGEMVSANSLLSCGGDNEVSLLWTDPSTGLRCKGRADRIFKGREVLLDLKTVSKATPRAASGQAERDGWYFQAAFYQWGVQLLTGVAPQYLVIAIDRTEPYECCVLEFGESFLAAGLRESRDLLRAIAFCREKDAWPDFSHIIHKVEKPAWHRPIGAEVAALLSVL